MEHLTPSEKREPIQVQFTGGASEYFAIWIVNVVLSVITLGIYSAWAKVRRKRYLSQHTSIAGRRFDYHATGLQILIGRIIIVVALVLFSVASSMPELAIVLNIALLLALPWLINRSLRFNARMTSWSGLRFDFVGSYGRAFLALILYPVLSVFSLYLAYPFAERAAQKYIISGHRFGHAEFSFNSAIGPFYKAFLITVGWVVLGIALITAAILGLGWMEVLQNLQEPGANQEPGLEVVGIFALIYIGVIVTILPAGFIYKAYIRNAIYAGAELEGGHRFSSTVNAAVLAWIGISNAFAIVFSMYLLIPWAEIRMARYLAKNTYVHPADDLDQFVGDQAQSTSAIGDAYTDIEGIDVGVAF